MNEYLFEIYFGGHVYVFGSIEAKDLETAECNLGKRFGPYHAVSITLKGEVKRDEFGVTIYVNNPFPS